MPLFAFANAGVKIDLSLQHAEIGFGLLAGTNVRQTTWYCDGCVDCCEHGDREASSGCKLEILARVWISRRNWFHHVIIHCHVGVRDLALVDAAKRGIIAGSLFAGIAGAVLLRVDRSLRDVN
jgi:hypothetical protein